MINKIIVNLGLAIIPFVVWLGDKGDIRQPKIILALAVSLALSLSVLFREGFKPYKNIWILLLLGYIPLSFAISPSMEFDVLGVKSGCLWYWKAYMFLMIFFLGHVAVSNMKLSKEDVTTFLKVISWGGFIMAILGIFQALGFNQIFLPAKNSIRPITGMMGNENILASFLIVVIPIALYLKEYIKALVILIVVILTNSQMAIGALIVSLMFLVGTKSKRLAIAMASILVICSLVIGVGYFHSPAIKSFVGDSGRFELWQQAYTDIKESNYVYTGLGIGSFRYLYHANNPQVFQVYEAHNEYLEFFYNTGIIGLLLLLSGMWVFLKKCFPLNRLKTYLLTSFFCLAICATGMYVWQMGATIFLTIVITGILNNEVADV